MHRTLLLLLLGLAIKLGADRSAQAYDDHSTIESTEARAVDSPSVLTMAIDMPDMTVVLVDVIDDVANVDCLERASKRGVADAYRFDRHTLVAQLAIRMGVQETNLALTLYDMDADDHSGLFDDSGAVGIWI